MTKTSYALSFIVHAGVAACFAAPLFFGANHPVQQGIVEAAVQPAGGETLDTADATQNVQYAALRAAAAEKPSTTRQPAPQPVATPLPAAQSDVRTDTANAEAATAATAETSRDATAASDIQSEDGQPNLGARINNLGPKVVAALLSTNQAILVVRFDGNPMYVFDGRTAALWPDDGCPQFSQREYGLVGEDRDAALRAVQNKFGYGSAALARAEVRLAVRAQIDSLIHSQQLASIRAAKLAQPDIFRTVGELVMNDAGVITDYRVQSLELKNRKIIRVP